MSSRVACGGWNLFRRWKSRFSAGRWVSAEAAVPWNALESTTASGVALRDAQREKTRGGELGVCFEWKSTLVFYMNISVILGQEEPYRLFGAGWWLAVSADCADGGLCVGLRAVRFFPPLQALSVSAVSLCWLRSVSERQDRMDKLSFYRIYCTYRNVVLFHQ